MRKSRLGALAALGLLYMLAASGCASGPAPIPQPTAAPTPPAAEPDPVVRVTLLQLNDVYEIEPVEGGRSGGLARVATLRKELLRETPHVVTLIAGDFLSPSAMGTAKIDGERLHGRQMVAVLNVMGLDLATLGNHEFDVGEESFLKRLSEAEFRWLSGNVLDARGEPFPGVAEHEIMTFGAGDRRVRIGFLGSTLVANSPSFETYTHPIETAKQQAAALAGEVDVVVAVTHLEIEQDLTLAEEVPEIDLILGGHEHENIHVRRGSPLTSIVKADANARSVYVHEIAYDTATGEAEITSRFVPITPELADDPETKEEVDRWVEKSTEAFRAEGFEPSRAVVVTTVPLDGRESRIRNGTTNLTELIANGLLAAVPEADLAVYNSGSIRVDDVLPAGPITEYDVIRVLPFGGSYVTIAIKGSLLSQVLDQGVANRGSGGFLQAARVSRTEGSWLIAGEPLDPERTYVATTSDFLVSGRESGLDYLNPDNPDLEITATHGDIRETVIAQLKREFGAAP